jgi:polyhydroxyalkanoate synthesis regulator phasin
MTSIHVRASQIEATNRCIANSATATDRARRHILSSQEDISSKQRKYAERSDQGHHAILDFLDGLSDQVAEGHEEMASKKDVDHLKAELADIKNTLKNGVFIPPAKEEEPDEYLEPVDD